MVTDISKLLIPLERPGEFLLLLLIAGVILSWFIRFRRAGIILTTAAAVGFGLIAYSPLASWVTAPLEDRFPRPVALPNHIDGLIVLGGAVDPGTTIRRGLPSLNSEAERMTEFVRLAKLYPAARLVFSGGGVSGGAPPGFTETEVARLFFRQQGLDIERIIFENRSRNTFENVLYSKAIVKPRPGQIWLLVASARDVPRCMGVFRRLGWPVLPIPVAYKAAGVEAYGLTNNLPMLDKSVHEWLGLAAYRLGGKTDRLFPAP